MLSFRWRLLVDLVSLLAGCVLLWTGILMWFILPPGSRGSTVWQWTRHDFGEVHQWAAAVMAVNILLHLFLNWQWFMGMLHKFFKASKAPTRRRRLILGIIALIMLMGLLGGSLLVANEQKVMTQGGGGGGGRHRGDEHSQVDTPQTMSINEYALAKQ